MRSGPGFVGGRQAGAGFGGCTVAAVDAAQIGAFVDHVEHAYAAVTGIQAHVFPVQSSPGAGPLAVV